MLTPLLIIPKHLPPQLEARNMEKQQPPPQQQQPPPPPPPQQQSLWHDSLFGRQQGRVPLGSYMRRVNGHGSMVARLKLDARLEGHRGCVNTVAFSSEGDLAVTGRCGCAFGPGG